MNHAHLRRYVAEGIAVFFLTLAVSLAIANQFPLTPVLAALVLGMFVYTVGPISGAHVNPAVTLGLWSAGKIKKTDALLYIVAQLLGAVLAYLLSMVITGQQPGWTVDNAPLVGLGEFLGAFLLVFGVSAVAHGRVREGASGVVVGGSLLMGITVTSGMSAGILNPAVALGVGSVSVMYLVAPLIGGILAAQLYAWLSA